MNASQVAQRLNGRKSGTGWVARCPGHEDKHASLSISPGNDGKVLLKCHAGCDFGHITARAGLEAKDLFPEEPRKGRSHIVDVYDYRDEEGELLYQVVRFEPKDFRQRMPSGSGWSWSTRGVRRVLYRLPELRALEPGSLVFVCEGEKDADALTHLGLNATTASGGGSQWPSDAAGQLEGLRVVCLPDRDETGSEYASRASESMSRAGVSVAVVNLPNLPPKGDVSDWLNAGGTKGELVALAESALGSAESAGMVSSARRMRAANETRLRNIPRVIPYSISYLDDELLGIHPNDIIVLMASTGAGKTTLGSILAQRAAGAGRRVAFFALEAYQGEIELRVLYRVICILAKEQGVFKPWMTQQLWIKRGIEELNQFIEPAIQFLEKKLATLSTYYRSSKFDKGDIRREFLAQQGKADLIVLDHLHYVDSDGPNENLELKNVIKTIRDCGQQLDIPVIVIAHVRKQPNGPTQTLLRVDDLHGSSDVAKMATVIVAVAPARDEEFRSDDPGIANTFMTVLKDRIGGDKGYAALMRFSLEEMTYRERYRLCRRLPNGKVERAEKLPGWATKATLG